MTIGWHPFGVIEFERWYPGMSSDSIPGCCGFHGVAMAGGSTDTGWLWSLWICHKGGPAKLAASLSWHCLEGGSADAGCCGSETVPNGDVHRALRCRRHPSYSSLELSPTTPQVYRLRKALILKGSQPCNNGWHPVGCINLVFFTSGDVVGLNPRLLWLSWRCHGGRICVCGVLRLHSVATGMFVERLRCRRHPSYSSLGLSPTTPQVY